MFIQLMNTTIWNLRVGNQNSEIMKWTGMLLLTCKICVWLVKTSTSRRLCNNHLYTVGFVANRGKLLHRLVFKCTRWLFKKCMHWISYDDWVEGKMNKKKINIANIFLYVNFVVKGVMFLIFHSVAKDCTKVYVGAECI